MNVDTAGRASKRAALLDSLLLIIGMGVAISIVNPIGNFPLNDDWSFARTIDRMFRFGMYVPTGWTVMTLLTNVVWGSLFCLPAGFSFNALRASSLIAALVGVLAVYWGAREVGARRSYCMVAALTLAFNPIFFALSNTFMTDVLFSSLLIVGALFFVRYLRRGTSTDWVLGLVISLAATMSRQLGLAVPLAFAITYIVLNGIGVRVLIKAVSPILICAVALFLYQLWLSSTGRLTPLYSAQSAMMLSVVKDPKALIRHELINGYKALLYTGLFLAPVLLFFIPSILRSRSLQRPIFWLAILAVSGGDYFFNRYLGGPSFPFSTPGNVLARFGIGPLTLRDTYFLDADVPILSHRFWLVITSMALSGAVLTTFAALQFGARFASEVANRKFTGDSAAILFLWITVGIYLPIVFTGELFDRYLLPALVVLLLAVAQMFPNSKRRSDLLFESAAMVLALAFAIFSIGSTRDYLMWNRMRWEALNDLTQRQSVSPEKIDGGFEFNGFLLYDRNYRPQLMKSWWWVEEDTYVISFNPMFGYTTIKEYPYAHWLPPYEGKILVLKRIEF